MFITVCLIPYNNPLLKDPTWGTYSVTLSALGIPEARHIVNFVVLTSVCSCFNSALYTCSRMMYSLSKRGDAPKSFGLTNHNNSPWVGVIFSSFLRNFSCEIAIARYTYKETVPVANMSTS